jgi:Flp pilus assembly protein TadD
LVRTAILTQRVHDALSHLDAVTRDREPSSHVQVARSRLLAATNAHADALEAVQSVLRRDAGDQRALEQLASIYADTGDGAQVESTAQRMRQVMPTHAATSYYAAVAALLNGDASAALRFASEAVASDPTYAAAYDLLGAALAKLGDRQKARAAFETSLTFDAHDSTAYANLGVLALDEGDAMTAVDYFAEALWLDADSRLAREGLRRAWRDSHQ